MPAPVEIHQGDDSVFRIAVLQADGSVQPVAGATIVARIGLKAAGITAIQAAGTVIDSVAGVVEVAFTAAQTATLSVGRYDLQIDVTLSGVRDNVYDEPIIVQRRLPAA